MSLKEVKLDVNKEAKLVVMFDPAYRPDRHSRKHKSSIEVSYKEHPHKASVTNSIYLTYCMCVGLYSIEK